MKKITFILAFFLVILPVFLSACHIDYEKMMLEAKAKKAPPATVEISPPPVPVTPKQPLVIPTFTEPKQKVKVPEDVKRGFRINEYPYAFKLNVFNQAASQKNYVTLDSYLGNGKIILIFGSTWCGPCVSELAILEQVHKARPEVFIFWIDAENVSWIEKFFSTYEVPFTIPILLDDQRISNQYQVFAIPQTIGIGLDGMIKARLFGPFENAEQFNKFIDSL